MSSPADDDLKAAAAKLARTEDALDPVAREDADRAVRRVQKRGLIGVAIIVAVSNLVLACVCVVSVWFATHPVREYFASDNGRIFPMIPMSQPYRKASDVIAYAKETIDASFTLDFNNYRGELENVRARYTQMGFKSFIDGLQHSGILATLQQRRMNLTSATGVGVLSGEGEADGAHYWIVRFPLTLKLVGQTTEMPEQRLIATVRVQRIPTLDSIEGIGVAEVITKPQ